MSSAYVPHTAPTTTSLRPSFAHVLRQTGMAVGDALSRLSMLLHDSREGLAAKDEQLASYGVSWSMDLAYETELARQMAAARHQRLGRREADQAGAPGKTH